MPQYPLNQKEIYICLGVIACFLFALLWAHPAAAVIGLIALAAFFVYCRKRRSRQKEELYAYLAEMVMSVEDTSSYAVRNLSMAILLVDRAVRFCGVIRSLIRSSV